MIIPSFDYYETPLEKSLIDKDFINQLAESDYFVEDELPFTQEHSIDNEIPFIQYLFPNSKIVPIIAGQFDESSLKSLANFFKNKLLNDDQKTLIVISSDFTHYGNSFKYVPFKENVKENISKLDHEASRLILDRNSDDFCKYKKNTKNTICGFMPILFLMEILPDRASGQLLKYQTSGDLTGDFQHSVSYLSFIFKGEQWK